MAIEDEGLEPNFEISEEPKNKKKKEVKLEPGHSPDEMKKKTKGKRKTENNKNVQSTKEEKKACTVDSIVEGPKKKNKKAKNKKSEGKKFNNDAKCMEILNKLKEIKLVFQVRETLAKHLDDKDIDAEDSQKLLQRWRRMQKNKLSESWASELINMKGSLDDVKNAAEELMKKRRLKPKEAKEAIYRWQHKDERRENRRVGRQNEQLRSKFCFQCRKHGHLLSDCPEKDAEDSGPHVTGICFKCGSGEHSVHKCPRKHVKGFPFATCFICNQQGHLSRDCKNNINGIYPEGGSCNVCGSQNHLKRDCPELAAQKKEKDEKKIIGQTITAMSRPDEDYDVTKESVESEPNKKKQKIVKF